MMRSSMFKYFYISQSNFSRFLSNTPGIVEKWIPVVGLEIHAQIASKSKLFSPAGTTFASPPNSQVSVVDAALPGTLPVLNRRCVEAGILTALALNCKVNEFSTFDRKHYFYSDLPAGYQITQQHNPIASNGCLEFVTFNPAVGRKPQKCKTHLKQIQLEQDSGKSMHDETRNCSFIDLNRAGMALMELVFEPDLVDGEEAASLVKELSLILERLGVCSCLMEEGALRVDANISVRKESQPLGVRTEVKNLNSIRSVQKAIDYEIKRQVEVLENGGKVLNETRSFNIHTKKTEVLREKESILDYRIMPEPNLPPLRLFDSSESKDLKKPADPNIVDIHELRKTLPIFPKDDRDILTNKFGLTLEQAVIIVNEDGLFKYYCKVMEKTSRSAKLVANWLLLSVLKELNQRQLPYTKCPISAEVIGDLIDILQSEKITPATGNLILEMLFAGDQRYPSQIMIEQNWDIISDEREIELFCLKVFKENPKEFKKYQAGNKKMLNKLLKELKISTNQRIDLKKSVDIIERLVSNGKE